MYPELEKYYAKCLDEKKEMTDIERDDILSFTRKLYQIGLLENVEYEHIIDMLTGSLSKHVHELQLSVRTQNALARGQIYSYRQIRGLLTNEDGEEQLFHIRNLGNIGIGEIIDQALLHGIATKEEILGSDWIGYKKAVIEEICTTL